MQSQNPNVIPPAESGHVLVVFPRGGPAEEKLHILLDEYRGRMYCGLRVWAKGSFGRHLPVKGKGCSVRISELDAAIESLQEARRIANRETGAIPARPKAAARVPSGDRP